MSKVFKHSRRVEFRDTDMAGIVHFSVFFAYMEQAEHELLRSLGSGVIQQIDRDKISWPRVSARCDYRRAIRYDDLIDLLVQVRRIGNKSVTYEFKIMRDEELVAEGTVTAVCCRFAPGKPPQAIDVPRSFREKLEPFVLPDNTDSRPGGSEESP